MGEALCGETLAPGLARMAAAGTCGVSVLNLLFLDYVMEVPLDKAEKPPKSKRSSVVS